MADLPPYRDTNEDTGVRPGTPRWVKVFGIIVIVLVLLAGIIVFAGVGGEHGPGRHAPSGDAGGHTPPSNGHENTGGVGSPAASSASARTVEVTTLDTMTFQPNRINVSAGETVTFMVTNTGQAIHEFTLGDATMQQQHADEMVQMTDGMAHDDPNSIRLRPGETSTAS